VCQLPNLQLIDVSYNPISERSLDALTVLLNTIPNLVVNMRNNNVKNKFAARKMSVYEQQNRLNL